MLAEAMHIGNKVSVLIQEALDMKGAVIDGTERTDVNLNSQLYGHYDSQLP